MSGADVSRRRLLIGAAAIGAALVLGLPLAVVFAEALRQGWLVYARNLTQPDTLHAIGLTALTAVVVVPINIGFGISAAWLVTRFRFPGRRLLVTIIDLPFSISPIVAGVSYLFVYGARGVFGPALQSAGISVMFTVWAIFLVSLFVTAPFVARELIPLMETQGTDEEEAAMGLGASGFQTFVKVTLPRIKWALLYGAILCNARVMGEFGAVSVVSGNIRGVTNTLPLQVELLYNDYNAAGAFAAASVLALLAIVTLALKAVIERRDPMLQLQGARGPLKGDGSRAAPR
jgi:sulfate transport system permease protein